jgi:hypothetical protein
MTVTIDDGDDGDLAENEYVPGTSRTEARSVAIGTVAFHSGTPLLPGIGVQLMAHDWPFGR